MAARHPSQRAERAMGPARPPHRLPRPAQADALPAQGVEPGDGDGAKHEHGGHIHLEVQDVEEGQERRTKTAPQAQRRISAASDAAPATPARPRGPGRKHPEQRTRRGPTRRATAGRRHAHGGRRSSSPGLGVGDASHRPGARAVAQQRRVPEHAQRDGEVLGAATGAGVHQAVDRTGADHDRPRTTPTSATPTVQSESHACARGRAARAVSQPVRRGGTTVPRSARGQRERDPARAAGGRDHAVSPMQEQRRAAPAAPG